MYLEKVFLSEDLKYIFLFMLVIYISGALISLILHKRQKTALIISNSAVIAASVVGSFFSLMILSSENKNILEFSFASNIKNISIDFRIDNLSALFILIISLISLTVSLYSYGYLRHYLHKRNLSLFGFLYNFFVLSMVLVVSSGHLFFFLIVWELMSLISYFLVVFENEKAETQKAGVMYIIMTHIGTAFIIAAFVLIFKYSGTAYFSSINLEKTPLAVKNIIFLFSLIGFGTKAGLIPLHVWLPKAHPAAPSNISALMSGVMIKTAVYGIIRVCFGFLDPQYLWWGTLVLVIGGITTILGIAFALMENNIKRLLAYSSVENIGIIMIGVGIALTSYSKGYTGIAVFAISAALLHTLNHSIFKSMLFLGAGAIHYSTDTKNMEKLGGLIKRMPFTALFFLCGTLSISSIPPFNGFTSEWLIYQSLFAGIGITGSWYKIILILIVALLGMAGVLVAASFIKTFGIAFLALPRTSSAKSAEEVPKSMLAGMGILSFLCILFGILPGITLRLIENVSNDFFGNSISSVITGKSSFLMFSDKSSTSISLAALVIAFLILIPVLLLIVNLLKGKAQKRVYKTWDCGYRALDSRMQYSATGFSKPLRIVFRALYRPNREFEVESGATEYFFKSAQYKVSTQSIFEKYMYEPIIKNVINFARRTRFLIQTGSIHTYLIYIFVVIVVMFIYYAKS
ncbi:MAG: hydrogenase 4 subunit B [Clostridia bacterium]|nr:hydrogenase 4 subunit B [Clostridia bacterium]